MRAWRCLAVWMSGWTLAWALAGCDSSGPAPGSGEEVAKAPGNAPSPATPASTSAGAEDRYRKLLGRWQRTDADYVVEVRSLDGGTGRGEVAYFNPRPIRVSQVQAAEEGGKVTLFVELDDVGYPGCNYRLTYFPATDQLYGVYYQAAIEQSFDVEFERVR